MVTFANSRVHLTGLVTVPVAGTAFVTGSRINSFDTESVAGLLNTSTLGREEPGRWFSVLDGTGSASKNNIVVDFGGSGTIAVGCNVKIYGYTNL